jgi:hypothetical protein
MENYSTPAGKDPAIWEIAQRRASFKRHLLVYLLVNAGLWLLWYFGMDRQGPVFSGRNYPWPVWSSFGWGIGLLFHFLGAYVRTGFGDPNKEYDRLINQRGEGRSK